MGTRRLALQIIALILAAVLLVVLLAVAPLDRVTYWAVDLGCYRAAALALRNGADPYLQESLRKYADGAPIGDIVKYTYPPFFLLFILPLTWLPLFLAIRVWLILNLCMLAASVVLLSKALSWDLTAKRFLVVMLGIVAFLPTVYCLALGQASIFVLFWLAAAFYWIKQKRDVWAGVCLALCFTKLQVLALVPLVFLLQKRWRLVGSWALTLILSIVPFWRFLPSLVEALLWTTQANLTPLGTYCLPCLNAVAKLSFPAGLPRSLFIGITTLGVLALVAWIATTRGKDQESAEFDRVFALAIAASLLTAGYVRTHDLVLLLVPLAILLNDARRAGISPASRRTSGASVALVFASLAYLFPYLLQALSLLVLVLRSALFHIASTLSVMVGLLVLLWIHPDISTDSPVVSTDPLSNGIMAGDKAE